MLLLCLTLTASGCQERSDTERGIWRFPDSEKDNARCVAHYESTGNERAVSAGGGNWGLFQINAIHRRDFERVTGRSWDPWVLDAGINGSYAAVLWEREGWRPWSVRKRCGL